MLLIIQGPAQWPPLPRSLPGVPNSELASPSSVQLRAMAKVSEPLLLCQPLRASLFICRLGSRGQKERRKPSFSCPGLCKGGRGQWSLAASGLTLCRARGGSEEDWVWHEVTSPPGGLPCAWPSAVNPVSSWASVCPPTPGSHDPEGHQQVGLPMECLACHSSGEVTSCLDKPATFPATAFHVGVSQESWVWGPREATWGQVQCPADAFYSGGHWDPGRAGHFLRSGLWTTLQL